MFLILEPKYSSSKVMVQEMLELSLQKRLINVIRVTIVDGKHQYQIRVSVRRLGHGKVEFLVKNLVENNLFASLSHASKFHLSSWSRVNT